MTLQQQRAAPPVALPAAIPLASPFAAAKVIDSSVAILEAQDTSDQVCMARLSVILCTACNDSDLCLCCEGHRMSPAHADNHMYSMQHASAKAPEQPDAVVAALPPIKRRRTSQLPKKQEEYTSVSPAEAAGEILLYQSRSP